MICQHCGAQNEDDSQFCGNCGKSLETVTKVPVQETAPKKKIKSSVIIVLAVVGIIIICGIIMANMSGNTDYIDAVKTMVPPNEGFSCTYGDALDKYITGIKWKERKQSDVLAYVDASGKVTDTDGNIQKVVITFEVTPYGDESDNMVWIAPYSIKINDTEYVSDTAGGYLYDFCEAYETGYATLAAYYNAVYPDNADNSTPVQRQYLTVTVAELNTAYENNRLYADNTYTENWVEITGQVAGVEKGILYDGYYVILGDTPENVVKSRENHSSADILLFGDYSVHCLDIPESEMMKLNTGDIITIRGKVDSYSGFYVDITNCEIYNN
ncbi:MAG: zinc-ribbon domain-containing protein [Oscillospiraceae bacterium]|nr:zinc-ribbon domain-containing protein [Oscillospiraceae bacterium]